MRPAPAERTQAQNTLLDEFWTEVCVAKNKLDSTNKDMFKMMKYCEEMFGPGRIEPSANNWLDEEDVWYVFTWYGYWNFYFKNERDATMFILRWIG